MVTSRAATKKRALTRRRLTHAMVLAVAGSVAALLLIIIQPFYTFNLWFSDQFLESETPTANIVIVGIDDDSLDAYGKWSQWPRSLHAQAVDNLSEAGATTIGFDVIFADSSPDDAPFADAIKRAGNVVLAGAGTGVPLSDQGIKFADFLLPAPALQQAAGAVGHVDVIPDPDGKVRRISLIVGGPDGVTYPALSVAVLQSLFHQPLPPAYPRNNGTVNLLARDIPVDENYSMRLNYAVNRGDIPYISYGDVVKGNFDPATVKNKIVLIGMTATGDIDTFAVPNSRIRIPGVILHAAAIDTILRTSYLTETGTGVTLLTMTLLILICALALPLFGTWYWTDILKGFGLVIGSLVFYLIAVSLIAGRGYILNVLYPALILAVLSAGNTIYIAMREQKDKGFVKDLFGRYVSPDVSKQIVNLATEGKLKLGGEDRVVTVLFADIRNFTQMSEGLRAEEVVQMLNYCLPVVIDAIVRNNGMVNKFAGDNIMGVWNAPKTVSDHARLAVKAAWEAQQAIARLGSGSSGCGCIQFGIGINTGSAIAGNIGAAGRAEYTVIGDTVNLASRICNIAPGGQVMVGPETYRLIKDLVDIEEMGVQTFKGKSKSVPVYRIKGWLSGGSADRPT